MLFCDYRVLLGCGSMGLRPLRVFWCSFLVVVCLSGEPDPQTTTSGGLTGVVTDQSKAVEPRADVEIRDNSKGTVFLKDHRRI
jgi:hypothetical protein